MCASGAATGRRQAGLPVTEAGGVRPVDTSAPPDFRLSRRLRIDDPQVFLKAFETCASFAGRFMVLRRCEGPGPGMRLGVVVSRRTLRRAVDRNRAKRLIREAFRLNRHRLCGQADIVIVVRRGMIESSRAQVEKELLKLAAHAGLLEGKSDVG